MNQKLLMASFLFTSSFMINAKDGMTRTDSDSYEFKSPVATHCPQKPATVAPYTPAPAPVVLKTTQHKELSSKDHNSSPQSYQSLKRKIASETAEIEAEAKAKALLQDNKTWENFSKRAQMALRHAYFHEVFFDRNKDVDTVAPKIIGQHFKNKTPHYMLSEENPFTTYREQYEKDKDKSLDYIFLLLQDKLKTNKKGARQIFNEISRVFPDLKEKARAADSHLIPLTERKELQKNQAESMNKENPSASAASESSNKRKAGISPQSSQDSDAPAPKKRKKFLGIFGNDL